MTLGRKPTLSEVQQQVDYINHLIREDKNYPLAEMQIAVLRDAGCEQAAMELGRALIAAQRDA